MTQDAKSYLQQIFKLDAEVDNLEENRQAIYASFLKAANITDLPKVPAKGNQMEERMLKVVEISDMVNAKVDELLDLKIKIFKQIEKLDERDHRLVLEKRYIQQKSWETICGEMAYSKSNIFRLHSEALGVFWTTMEC